MYEELYFQVSKCYLIINVFKPYKKDAIN